ncbi:50S ribosomal protein L18 [Clostridioides difficile]|uniref:50S ribosomal protein L18 n=1 Tax=Clostridioides difficile TaxID=1496 RepID=UPI000BB184E7
MYDKIIYETKRVTLVSTYSIEAGVKSAVIHTENKEAAKKDGELVDKKAVEKGLTEVVFDRGGY